MLSRTTCFLHALNHVLYGSLSVKASELLGVPRARPPTYTVLSMIPVVCPVSLYRLYTDNNACSCLVARFRSLL